MLVMRSESSRLGAQELEALARKYATTVERIREVIRESGSRSPEQVKAALRKHFMQRSTATGTAGSG